MCLMILGAAVSAAGALASASAQSASYKAQAQYQKRQSLVELQKGAYEANRQATVNDQRLADQRGQYFQAGIALEGSPTDVISSSATQASLDEQAIKYGAQIRSDNAKFESQLATANASTAMTAGFFNAAGAMIGGITDQMKYNASRTMIRNPYANF